MVFGSRAQRSRNSDRSNDEPCDVVIVGGGLAGLSTALYLSQMDPHRQVTVLDREPYGHDIENREKQPHAQPASFAAAGMLAPQSERLPPGHLLDLCLASRSMYPEFCRMVETLARESGEEGAPFLFHNQFPQSDSSADPYSVGYVSSGGFLAPAFAGDAVATWAPPTDSGSAVWLDALQVRDMEPSLHPDVVGAWWFPDDASVDARRLTCSLRAACVAVGVRFWTGSQYEVTSLDLVDGTCQGLWLGGSTVSNQPRYVAARTVLIANGAWMRQLLPVPIEPHKGQSLALKLPPNQPPLLNRVLFAQDSYIVPRVTEGRIIIGATVEAGSYNPHVTPAGLLHIMTHALQLVPALKDLAIDETWVGLRPTTPDKAPILGKTPWKNVFVAGGYWRNGVLLAPKTGELMAKLIVSASSHDESSDNNSLGPDDVAFLDALAWDRFTTAAGSSATAAQARYAASMHPIHRRSSMGVSAAVGTELGSYSSARSAAEERKRDRESLWNNDSDDSLERAAAMGKQDAQAYRLGSDEDGVYVSARYFEGASDALTVGSATSERDTLDPVSVDGSDLIVRKSTDNAAAETIDTLYERVRENKAQQGLKPEGTVTPDTRPDPGFRLHHVDPVSGESRVVPPYMSPGEFLASIGSDQEAPQGKIPDKLVAPTVDTTNGDTSYSETTYDGYQDIQQANSRQSRADELHAMREARRRNRQESDDINGASSPPYLEAAAGVLTVGVAAKDGSVASDRVNGSESIVLKSIENSVSTTETVDTMYEKIRGNKAKQGLKPEETVTEDARPDPGFRIYHVDPVSGESRVVPPYMSPGEFLASTDQPVSQNEGPVMSSPVDAPRDANYSETTYDGYQDIEKANARQSRAEELNAMREARRLNRLGQDEIDHSKIGAQRQ